MNTIRTLGLALAAASLLGNTALAQDDTGLTRAQVMAELAAARANGSLSLGGEAGLRLRDLHPQMYAATAAAGPGKSRSLVLAELAEARANGDLVRGESSLSDYEISPHRYPARPLLAGKSRDEVRTELAVARRLGDLEIGEHGRTLAETFPQQYAAARAEHATMMRARAAAQADAQVAQRAGEQPR